MMAGLYRIKTELSDTPRDQAFCTLRAEREQQVLAKLKAWLEKKGIHAAPETALGKAVTYTLGRWDKLIRYLESPHLTPGTNRVRNEIRPFVVGKKNKGSHAPRLARDLGESPGANAMARLYSLIETANANDIAPYQCFRVAIDRLPFAETED